MDREDCGSHGGATTSRGFYFPVSYVYEQYDEGKDKK